MNDGKKLTASQREPVKTFEGHEKRITSIATFPDGKRIATGSLDKTIRIWRVEDGREMKKLVMEKSISAMAILRDGMQVVSAVGDTDGTFKEEDLGKTVYRQLWVHDTRTGRVVAGPLDGHTNAVIALDISPDGSILAYGSADRTVILWDTTTWQRKDHSLKCEEHVIRVRFSPTGQLLGVSTSKHIQIWDLERRERLVQFNGHIHGSWNNSLTWTRDGVHLLSAGDYRDPVIRAWGTSTWTQAGDPWTGHSTTITHILLNPAGTLLASASVDHTVRLWQLATGIEVSRYEHSHTVVRVAFSVDGCFIFGADEDGKTLQWEIPEDILAAARDALVREVKTEVTTFNYYSMHELSAPIQGWSFTQKSKGVGLHLAIDVYIDV
jgi:WD40 repeat protein